MSIESDIIDGNVQKVVQQIPQLENDRVGSLFLFAVTFEQEEIATKLLEARSAVINPRIVEEVFKAAAVHNEAELVKIIISQCGKSLDKETMLEAIKMAAVDKNIDVINVIAKDGNLGEYINTEDEKTPHLIKIAVDTGDYWFLERVLELPSMDVEFHHSAYADKQKEHQMADLLKLKKTIDKQKKMDFIDKIYDYEKDIAAVGPHMNYELQRRKREAERSRYRL